MGTVHLDDGFDPNDPVGETRLVQSIAEREGFPDAIVAQVALDRPDVAQLIRAHLNASPLVRGIRHIVAWHDDPVLYYVDRPDMMKDPAWLRGFGLLGGLGLSFDLQVYPSQMVDAAVLARTHPDVSIVIDQAGMPLFRSDADRQAWHRGLERLAQELNVSIKLSGFGMCRHEVSALGIGPLVVHALRSFGPDRAMFASNFPVDGLFSSLAELYAAYAASVADMPDGDRRKVFAGTAARIYRLRGGPCPATEASRTMATTLIKNAAVLDVTKGELLDERDVLVGDGRIVEIGERRISATADVTIDLAGRVLMPGLCDAHVHVIVPINSFAQLTRWSPFYTAIRAVPILEGMLMRGSRRCATAGVRISASPGQSRRS